MCQFLTLEANKNRNTGLDKSREIERWTRRDKEADRAATAQILRKGETFKLRSQARREGDVKANL